MVNVLKGILIKCDPVMKQLLLHLDETLALGSKFVLANLDDCHLFVAQDVYEQLKVRVDELYEKVYNNYSTSNPRSFE